MSSEYKFGTLTNRFKQKNFTVSNSEDRWCVENQCVFYENSTEAKDGKCLYFGNERKKSQIFLIGCPSGILPRRMS